MVKNQAERPEKTMFSKTHAKNIGLSKLGKPCSEETKRKIRESMIKTLAEKSVVISVIKKRKNPLNWIYGPGKEFNKKV